jgi:hypothetical protein
MSITDVALYKELNAYRAKEDGEKLMAELEADRKRAEAEQRKGTVTLTPEFVQKTLGCTIGQKPECGHNRSSNETCYLTSDEFSRQLLVPASIVALNFKELSTTRMNKLRKESPVYFRWLRNRDMGY